MKIFGREGVKTTALSLLLVAWWSLGMAAMAAERPLKIGIMQIVEHPALDAARQGFVDALAEAGYKPGVKVVYDVQNAQGDMATAQLIAQKFVAAKVDLILAIATPTAQAAAKATDRIPILITAVTDPVAAGLVKSIQKPGGNVTGTSDLNPVADQLKLLQELAPKVRRVGIIYNAGETNSLVQVEMARKAADRLGLKVVEATVSNSSGVYQAAESLLGKVDAIYVPTDNTVVSALEAVLKVAQKGKLPVIGGEGETVKRGALATVGIDYYRLGRQTGKMAVEILKGKNPGEMPIQYQEELRLIINLKAARAIGLEVPPALLQRADEILR